LAGGGNRTQVSAGSRTLRAVWRGYRNVLQSTQYSRSHTLLLPPVRFARRVRCPNCVVVSLGAGSLGGGTGRGRS
jgi:hypothetical protein